MMYAGFPNEIVVIEKENPERRFTARIIRVEERYRGPTTPFEVRAIIEAGNGDFKMTVPQSRCTQVSASVWHVVLPASVIRFHGGQNVRTGRIRYFSQFTVGEDVRIYAKMRMIGKKYGAEITSQRRLSPDWYVYETNEEAGTVTLRQQNKFNNFRDYNPITVELHQMLRDVNDHLRAYIDGKYLIELQPAITEGDHNVSMSHDRVELQLGPYVHNQTSDAAVKAATEAFNLTDTEAASLYHYGGVPIQFCVRPSQFARFMILRDQYGGVNDFKGMRAKLVQQQPPVTRIDAATRPKRVTF